MKKIAKIASLILAMVLALTGINPESVYAKPTLNVTIKINNKASDEADDDQGSGVENYLDENGGAVHTEDDDDNVDLPSIPWTVYVYMMGGEAESEYGLASKNIQEMISSNTGEDVQFVIQTGGTKQWHLDDKDIEIDADKTERFLVKNGEIRRVWKSRLSDQADPDSLDNFIKWSRKYYPSDKSMFVFYGSGEGAMGLGTDEIYGDELRISDIVEGFERTGTHYDVLAFDSSYMADLDVLCNVSPYADYIVASEAMISEDGFDYAEIGKALSRNPKGKALYICKKICDSYYESCRIKEERYETLSVVESSKIDAVKAAATDYINAVIDLYNTDQRKFAVMLSEMQGIKSYSPGCAKDLNGLVEMALCEFPEFFDIGMPDAVNDAVTDAVYYRVQGKDSKYNGGISFTNGFELGRRALEKYEEIAVIPEYIALLDALKYDFHPSEELYDYTDKLAEAKPEVFDVKLALKENKKGLPNLNIISGIYNGRELDYTISKSDAVGREFIIQERSDVSINVKKRTANVLFDGSIVTIDGVPVVLRVISEDDYGAYFNIPVSVLNADGEYEDRILYVYYDNEIGDANALSGGNNEAGNELASPYSIIGMCRINRRDLAHATDDLEAIPEGCVMRAAYPEEGRSEYMYGEEFVFSNDSDILMEPLDDGEYVLRYFVKNGFGNKVVSDSQTFYMQDGKILMENPFAEEDNDVVNATKEEAKASKQPVLNIVSYKKYYGESVPQRLRDIHYDTPTEDVLNNLETLPEQEKSKVTMLCYICGADLEKSEGAGSDLLKYATMASSADGINVIFETGGATSWKYKGLDPDSIQRFELRNGKLVEISKVPAYNMSTRTAFSEFVNWGISNYPAEHYILYNYNHGGAWMGSCVDYNYDRSILSLEDWKYVLEKSGVIFDDIIFDECLMATVEVAAAVAPYARYMTAYEESQMALDYKWDRIFNYLYRHGDNFKPAQFGKQVINMNADAWDESANDVYFQTQSLIDLSKIQDLIDSLDEYARELTALSHDPGQFTKTMAEMEKSRSYTYDFQKDIGDMVGLSEGVSEEVCQKVINALDDMIVYKRSTYDQIRNNGLSMFFDLKNRLSVRDEYSDVCPIPSYVTFLSKAVPGWHNRNQELGDADFSKIDLTRYGIESEIITDEEDSAVSGIRLVSSEETVLKKSYNILKYDEEQNRFYGVATRNDFIKDGDLYYEKFDGRVASVNGVPCYLIFDSIDSDRIIYKIPVRADGTDMVIIVAFYPDDEILNDEVDLEKGTFEVLSVTIDAAIFEGGIPEKDPKLCDYNTELTMTFPEFDENGKTLYYIEGESVTYDENMKIGLTSIEDGDYILRYVIENAFGIKEFSEDMIVKVVNSRVSGVFQNEK